jgi:hypothetical protein
MGRYKEIFTKSLKPSGAKQLKALTGTRLGTKSWMTLIPRFTDGLPVARLTPVIML